MSQIQNSLQKGNCYKKTDEDDDKNAIFAFSTTTASNYSIILTTIKEYILLQFNKLPHMNT